MIKTDLKTKSLLESVYLDTGKRLLQLTDKGGKPIIQAIDLWNNQWQYLDKEKPFNFPCVFIEFVSIPWTQLGMREQQGTVTINLHIGSKTSAPSRLGHELSTKWLEHLRVIDAIHHVLSGWGSETGYMSSFTRTASSHDHDHDDIIAHVETYRVTVKDTSAMATYIKKEGNLFVLDLE